MRLLRGSRENIFRFFCLQNDAYFPAHPYPRRYRSDNGHKIDDLTSTLRHHRQPAKKSCIAGIAIGGRIRLMMLHIQKSISFTIR
jgi:hypothetical protein